VGIKPSKWQDAIFWRHCWDGLLTGEGDGEEREGGTFTLNHVSDAVPWIRSNPRHVASLQKYPRVDNMSISEQSNRARNVKWRGFKNRIDVESTLIRGIVYRRVSSMNIVNHPFLFKKIFQPKSCHYFWNQNIEKVACTWKLHARGVSVNIFHVIMRVLKYRYSKVSLWMVHIYSTYILRISVCIHLHGIPWNLVYVPRIELAQWRSFVDNLRYPKMADIDSDFCHSASPNFTSA